MPDYERGKASGTGANTRQGDVERGHLERRPQGRGQWKISNRAPSRRACLLGALLRRVPRAEGADVVPGAAVDLVGDPAADHGESHRVRGRAVGWGGVVTPLRSMMTPVLLSEASMSGIWPIQVRGALWAFHVEPPPTRYVRASKTTANRLTLELS